MKINIFYKSHLQKGVTIVEMMLYMAIFAILMTVLTQIFVSTLDLQTESKATSSVQQDGGYILSRLTYDIQRAHAVTLPAIYGIASPTLQITINGISYTYGLDANKNLVLSNDQGTSNLNSADTTVQSISFMRIGNSGGKSTIQISYQIRGTTQRVQGYQTQSFQTTVSLR